MIGFDGRMVLLDIEGTVSNLAFVHETLFPHARREVEGFLLHNQAAPAVVRVLEQMARDDGAASRTAWCPEPLGTASAALWISRRVHALMDADAKQTGLKQLQGLLWERGYRDGLLRAHIFPDVPPRLAEWRREGRSIRIYSSGSVAAQKLFFGFSEAGDLTPFLDGYHDTTTGPKREPASYRAIAAEAKVAPGEILFLSDVPEELDAAASAGLQTALVVRPGNRPVGATGHPRITSFAEIQ